MSEDGRDRWAWLSPATVVLAVAVFALPMVVWPMCRDQGIYAYTGWRLLEGEMPYRDVYTFKPPGTVFLHALSQVLFGPTIAAIRWLDLVLLAVTAVGTSWLVSRWSGSRVAGAAAGAATAWFHVAGGLWDTAQTDPWFGPFTVAAFVLVGRDGLRTRDAAAAGLLLSAAFWLKYTALGFALPLTVSVLWREGSLRERLRWLAAGVGGFVLGVVLVLAWMAAVGVLDDFWQAQQLVATYTGVEASKRGPWEGMLHLWDRARNRSLWIWPWLLGAGTLAMAWRAWRHPEARPGLLVLLTWGITVWLSIASQRRWFGYHAMAAGPVVAAFGGLAFAVATSWVPDRARVWVRAALASGLLGWAAWDLGGHREHWPAVERSLEDRDQFLRTMGYRQFVGWGRYGPIVSRIQQLTEPDEPIYVYSYDPQVMYAAQRRQVSRFLYTYPFINGYTDTRPAHAELMAALQEDPPAMFVVGFKDRVTFVTGNRYDSHGNFMRDDVLRPWVEEHYVRLDDVLRWTVYLRADLADRVGPRELHRSEQAATR